MKNIFYKNVSTFCLCFFFATLFAQAQTLQIKNTTNGKNRSIKVNQGLFFKLSEDGEYIKGKIKSMTDSSLVLFTPEEDDIELREVNLKDIYAIKKLSCTHKAGYVLGAVLIVGGAGTIAEAGSIAGDDGNDWLVRGIGAIGLAAGLVPYLIKPTEFVQGKNAEYKIAK
ncbi:MAG TPA: hypothetical protein VK750_00545 [Cytophagaceae bacterium]|jgi:hypothetical protein|nr:hypothetical protein [Cytophagaceae bacterium]